MSSAALAVRIKSAPPGSWYQFLVGHIFNVVPVKVEFVGHVYKYSMYEVTDFSFEGDVIWPSDCEVVSCQ